MKGYEKSPTQSVYILYENREKICAAASEHIFCFSKCVAAPRCISMFFKERAAASERYQWTTAFERKCAADICFVCGCFYKHFSVF